MHLKDTVSQEPVLVSYQNPSTFAYVVVEVELAFCSIVNNGTPLCTRENVPEYVPLITNGVAGIDQGNHYCLFRA